jgi:poly-gamma-glutamate capsule biosynthesis protein CapA/YwtB (metallophosphatase superfamily)
MKKFMVALILAVASHVTLAQDTTHLSLLFLGDIMQHDSQIADAYNPKTKTYDYDPCFRFVKPYTQSVDLAIGNLELTLAGPPYKGYPQFSAPDQLLLALKAMGMDVLVTANNHCVDTGKKGLERTIQMLDSLRIPHTGTFVDEVSRLNDHPLMVRKNGFNLALLNYTYGTNGMPVTKPNIVNHIDTAMMRKDIRKAKSMNPDMIIVFTHWGSEYQSLPSKWQKDITEHCFKHGAQVVIGAHPHVLQPMEWRKEKNQLIAYSLGNFVSGQRKRYTDGGAMITLELEKVTFPDGSALTQIDTANYILEWVYRTTDSEKNYYVLPVPTFETDNTGFIRDSDSKLAFETFVTDSRALYSKHNKSIVESREVPSDTLITYKVLLGTSHDHAETGNESNGKWTVYPPVPYGIETLEHEEGHLSYYSGDFLDSAAAEKYRAILGKSEVGKDAKIVKFVNGKRSE